MDRENPVEECDHEEKEVEYIERADGQHEIVTCVDCKLILKDRGRPEPDNVGDPQEGSDYTPFDECPYCGESSAEMEDDVPWWVCENPRCPVVHFNNG